MDDQHSYQENTPLSVEPSHGGSGGNSTGSIIGIVIIVLVLALGGLYFWGKRIAENDNANPAGSGTNKIE